MKKLFILITIFTASCSQYKKEKTPVKPYVIFYKHSNEFNGDGEILYRFSDAKGDTYHSYAVPDKYNLGDTIH